MCGLCGRDVRRCDHRGRKLRALRGHPSRVDPQEKGLSRMEQFRAEMVRAVYDSEGTSAAEDLMGSSLPSIVHRSFAEVGWDKLAARGVAGGGQAAACGERQDEAGRGSTAVAAVWNAPPVRWNAIR